MAGGILANIAVELEKALRDRRLSGRPGSAHGRLLASGDGWSVSDVLCTSGPEDRRFEEAHTEVSIAIVAAGTFQYRNPAGRSLLTPGSLLLGNAGQSFECGHEHAAGDRCISFKYDPTYFEESIGIQERTFKAPSLTVRKELSRLIARASAAVDSHLSVDWEGLAVELALEVVRLSCAPIKPTSHQPAAEARVTKIVRMVERCPSFRYTIPQMARAARVSAFHFVRVFEQQTGVTPHQFILRTRLRNAATALVLDRARVLDIAMDCGFGDISNFNRSFRAEFGANPRDFRRRFSL